MYNASHQYKILEHLQFGNIFVNACVEFIQQQELTSQFNDPDIRKGELEVDTNVYHINKTNSF